MLSEQELSLLNRAIGLSAEGMIGGHGGPFGCVIAKDGIVVGEGYNLVTSTNDPTAHAEIVAIREACAHLGTYQLNGCVIYTSCEPCPMCLGAIYWARPDRVIFSNTRKDAAAINFDDDHIYDEITSMIHERKIPFIHAPMGEALNVFERWKAFAGKKAY